MNFGKQPRRVNPKLELQLLNEIPKDAKVSVTSVLGDQEAFQFATNIIKLLQVHNYNVDELSQAVFSQPVVGQILDIDDKRHIKITIGSNP